MRYDIAGLRQVRAQKQGELDAIGTIDASTPLEALDRADALTVEIAALDRRIATAEAAQRVRAAGARAPEPIEVAEEDSLPTRVPAQAAAPAEPGITFAQMTRCLVLAKGDVHGAQRQATRLWGERHPAAVEFGAALNTNDANSGGFLVPERYSAEIIEMLWPRTTIRRNVQAAGNVVPLVGGTDNYPTVESGTSAYYIGEGADITASEPTFGNLRMVEKEMAALVPISNKLLRHSSFNVDVMVRNNIVRAIAQTEDLAFLRSTGAGAAPRGLRYWVNSANVFAANASVNLANIDADARTAELNLLQADIPMIAPTWLMAPRTYTYLRDLRDGAGQLVFPSLSVSVSPNSFDGGGVVQRPTWKGYPVEVTNNIPINLGSGTDSEVYLVDFGYVMIADSYQVRIDASDTASYMSAGSLVSAYSKNQTVIRALCAHDFGMQRNKAASVITGVQWK